MKHAREIVALRASKAIVNDPTAFARMETSEPEEIVLLEAARNAFTYIAGMTRRYKPSFSENVTNSGIWNFSFSVPSNLPGAMTAPIRGSIDDYLTYTILSKWSSICGDTDKQKEYMEEAAASLRSIVVFINTREAPTYKRPKLKRVQAMNFE